MEKKSKIKKRKYSRKGCKECKRRKIKCDESYPACYNCSRLDKSCVYETKLLLIDTNNYNEPSETSNTPWAFQAGAQTGSTLNVEFYKPNVELKGGLDKRITPDEEGTRMTDPLIQNQSYINTMNMRNLAMSPQDEQIKDVTVSDSLKISTPQSAATSLSPNPPAQSFNELNSIDMRSLLDEASGLVSDINHLLDSGVTETWGGNMNSVGSINLAPNEAINSIYAFGPRASPISTTNSEEMHYFHIDDFSKRIHADSYVSSSDYMLYSNTQLIDRCITENSLEEPHVKYLKTLTNTDLSYHLYPFASLIESNEVMKLLLTYLAKCPYLLTSLLAISATFQFNQTGRLVHDTARQKYIMVCFKSLNGAFTENSVSENIEMLTSNIEKLLLTVLILSSYFTATNFILDENVLTSWKAHLRGARDLLLHYGRINLDAYQSQNQFMSGGLALAKCWFFAIESSAALHSSLGGSLAKLGGEPSIELDEENVPYGSSNLPFDSEKLIYWESGVFDADIHPAYHAALQRVNMLCSSPTSSEFNLFWGFTSRTVRAILLYSSIMDSIRTKGYERVPMKWIVHLFRMIDDCSGEIIVPGVKRKTFEIPITSRGHPDYSSSGPEPKLLFPVSCYVPDVDENGNKLVFSWFDASHQLHLDNFLIKLMVQSTFLNLPRNHPHVQEQLNRLFSGFFFIKKKSSANYHAEKDRIIVESDNYYLCSTTFDNRCVMIQSIFRTLSTIVIREEEFEQIELFFMGLVKLGNGSSLSSLDMVARFKEQRKQKQSENAGDLDIEIYDYETLYDIPFA